MFYSHDNWLQLHSTIYLCKKLTNLKLYGSKLDPPPSTFKGFLFLKCLNLSWVEVSPHVIETLVASSPLLERFELYYERLELRIRAPNLKYLYLAGGFVELCVCAPLLDEMSVELVYNDSLTAIHQEQKSFACNYTKCIGGCTNLEKLHGEAYLTKYLSIGIESCHHPVMFHNLKVIELKNVNYEDMTEILVVGRLVIGAPNLHQLKLELQRRIGDEPDDPSEARDVCFRDFGCPPNFTLKEASGC